jgi:hypothetical protein
MKHTPVDQTVELKPCPDEIVDVIQSDRDAAAEHLGRVGVSTPATITGTREGRYHEGLARSFARYRLTLTRASPQPDQETVDECPVCHGRGDLWDSAPGLPRFPQPRQCDACCGTGKTTLNPIGGEVEKLRECAFGHGYLIATANIVHLHDQPGIAEDVLREGGVKRADMETLGLTEYDLKPLRAMFREIERKQRRAQKAQGQAR